MSWTLYRDIFEELQSGFKTLGLTLFNYNGPRVEWVKKSQPLNAWCLLKCHTYLNKPAAQSCMYDLLVDTTH